MPDPLTIRDAWTAVRDHIGTMSPTMDPDDHGVAADVFTALSTAMADHPDPDAEMTRADLPAYLIGEDANVWFARGGEGCALPDVIVRWIRVNVGIPAWVPRDHPE